MPYIAKLLAHLLQEAVTWESVEMSLGDKKWRKWKRWSWTLIASPLTIEWLASKFPHNVSKKAPFRRQWRKRGSAARSSVEIVCWTIFCPFPVTFNQCLDEICCTITFLNNLVETWRKDPCEKNAGPFKREWFVWDKSFDILGASNHSILGSHEVSWLALISSIWRCSRLFGPGLVVAYKLIVWPN